MLETELKQLPMILKHAFKGISYPFLLIPVVFSAVCFVFVNAAMPEYYDYWYALNKEIFERYAVFITTLAVVAALIRCILTRFAPFSNWLAGLTILLMMREIHWDWMSTGIYIGLLLLFIIAWLKYDLLEKYFESRFFLTLMTMIFLSYLIAVTFDSQMWTETERMDHVGQLAEEVVEDFGHWLVVLMVMTVRPKKEPSVS